MIALGGTAGHATDSQGAALIREVVRLAFNFTEDLLAAAALTDLIADDAWKRWG